MLLCMAIVNAVNKLRLVYTIQYTRCIMYILYDCRVRFRTLQHSHYIVIKSINIIYIVLIGALNGVVEIKLF